MSERSNKISNPNFLRGRGTPASWRWDASGIGARWERGTAKSKLGLTITTSRRVSQAGWSQVLTCKPGEFYRVDADVRCHLEAADERAGFVLSVQPLVGTRPFGDLQETPGVHVSSRTCTVRAFYQAPEGSRRVRLSVGVVNAKGWTTIESVRFLHTLEPEEDSHLLAIPPPPQAVPAPRTARTVCVWSKSAESRPLTAILRAALGPSNVVSCDAGGGTAGSPGSARATRRGETAALGSLTCDAVLLPDESPPNGMRTVKELLELAERHLVIVSLPAFAKLCGKKLSMRRVEQPDDPVCAKVVFAHHATRGFALADVFPHAWLGRSPGSFVQNHFRKSLALDRFLKKHGFTALLASMACQDVTTGRAVCLHKEAPGGGLYVVDLDPVEAESSTRSEANVAVYFLLSMLGHTQNGLGQFAMPVRGEPRLREMIREAGTRFREFVVHDGDGPVDQIEHQLVTIGREDESYGLPLAPKPLILVRSGLHGGDAESVCGALLWFKQLLRMPPHACPYAGSLAARFRFAWVPCAARWERRDGWRRSGSPPAVPMSLDFDGGELACVIDVVSVPRNEVRVVMAGQGEGDDHVSTWLPRLQAAFPPGRYFGWGPGAGEPFSNRDRFGWRRLELVPAIVKDDDLLSEDFHRQARRAGAQAIRLEVPGCDTDFVAQSIQRTDLVATLLEHVIGLQFGLAASNRTTSNVRFDGFSPIPPGEALVVDRGHATLRAAHSRAS